MRHEGRDESVCYRPGADVEPKPRLVSDSRDAVFPPKLRFQAFERFASASNQVHSFGPARCWIVLLSPAAHRNQQRQEIESIVGQAVDGLLSMGRIIAPRDDAVLDQRVEPVCQHIARDSFFGLKEFAEVALAREHQVTDDQKRPTVAYEFKRRTDRACR